MDNAKAYLLNVVSQWKQFCKSHKNFEDAINEILAENNSLKMRNLVLKFRVEELENKMKGGTNNG